MPRKSKSDLKLLEAATGVLMAIIAKLVPLLKRRGVTLEGVSRLAEDEGGVLLEAIADAVASVLAPKAAASQPASAPEPPHVLRIDRSVQFNPKKFIGNGWTIWRGPVDGEGLQGELDQDERMLAITEIDPRKMRFNSHLCSGESSITGEAKLIREEASQVLRIDALAAQTLVEEPGQNTLKVIQAMGVNWFEVLGTVLRDPDGPRYALYLYLDGDSWRWDYRWLDDRRYARDPSGSLAQ